MISPMGGVARPLIPGSDAPDFDAVWSRDGSRLAFGRLLGPSGSAVLKVAVASADGGNVNEIADGSGPAWSPNSREISFDAGSQQVSRVYVHRTRRFRPAPGEFVAAPIGRFCGLVP